MTGAAAAGARAAERGGWAAALLGGALQTVSFEPFGAWPLQIVGLMLLAGALRGARPARAALLGWLFAFVWITSSVWWIFISMHRYGGMPALLAAAATALLGAALSLYYAAAAAGWARWRAAVGAGPALSAAGWAACWLLAELARGIVFTGFPWLASGYAQLDSPLASLAPWVGVYGIGAVAAWLAAASVLAWPAGGGRRARGAWARAVAAPVGAVLLAAGLPADFTRSTGGLEVTLLQPAVAQDVKFDLSQVERVLHWHLQALAAARGTLVVTPESSIPLAQDSVPADLADALRAPFAGATGGDRAALLGLFTGNDTDGYTNSLVGLSRSSGLDERGAYVYGKRHLLPFGEFIPPGFGWFVALMAIPIGDQAHGTQTAPLAVGGQRVRPLICYEDLFGEDFAASVLDTPSGGATLFANATNLAWFGRWMVQDQHLQFSQMRALEFQRPVVRATNTGATAAVDHRGAVIARLAPERAGALDVRVDGRTGVTPYARWLAAAGLGPLAAAAALVLAGGAVGARRRRGPDL